MDIFGSWAVALLTTFILLGNITWGLMVVLPYYRAREELHKLLNARELKAAHDEIAALRAALAEANAYIDRLNGCAR